MIVCVYTQTIRTYAGVLATNSDCIHCDDNAIRIDRANEACSHAREKKDSFGVIIIVCVKRLTGQPVCVCERVCV